jgi:hypothetical protein
MSRSVTFEGNAPVIPASHAGRIGFRGPAHTLPPPRAAHRVQPADRSHLCAKDSLIAVSAAA